MGALPSGWLAGWLAGYAICSGADAILLIAAVLPNQDLEYFMKAATRLGMTCLIEVRGRVSGPAAAATPAGSGQQRRGGYLSGSLNEFHVRMRMPAHATTRLRFVLRQNADSHNIHACARQTCTRLCTSAHKARPRTQTLTTLHLLAIAAHRRRRTVAHCALTTPPPPACLAAPH